MLRHIMSLSLAVTACATFIPTKANAATLTFVPDGIIPAKPVDSIEFIFAFTPTLGSEFTTTFQLFTFDFDKTELSLSGTPTITRPNTKIAFTTTIARIKFDVLRPLRDGKSDIFDVNAIYTDTRVDDGGIATATDVVDIVPVPEPLTMLGAAAALGYGAILKRKYSKKSIS